MCHNAGNRLSAEVPPKAPPSCPPIVNAKDAMKAQVALEARASLLY